MRVLHFVHTGGGVFLNRNNSFIGTSITLNAANDVTYTGSGFLYEAAAGIAKGIIEKNLNVDKSLTNLIF